jgi:hypothetical protein
MKRDPLGEYPSAELRRGCYEYMMLYLKDLMDPYILKSIYFGYVTHILDMV